MIWRVEVCHLLGNNRFNYVVRISYHCLADGLNRLSSQKPPNVDHGKRYSQYHAGCGGRPVIILESGSKLKSKWDDRFPFAKIFSVWYYAIAQRPLQNFSVSQSRMASGEYLTPSQVRTSHP